MDSSHLSAVVDSALPGVGALVGAAAARRLFSGTEGAAVAAAFARSAAGAAIYGAVDQSLYPDLAC